MARKRYTPETIIRKLREAEILQGHVFFPINPELFLTNSFANLCRSPAKIK
jgi:hypothetical protein